MNEGQAAHLPLLMKNLQTPSGGLWVVEAEAPGTSPADPAPWACAADPAPWACAADPAPWASPADPAPCACAADPAPRAAAVGWGGAPCGVAQAA